MLYYFTTPASYTAGGTLVIDKRKLQLFQKESVLGDVEVDTATVQTEVEVLKSDNIGLAIIRKLHLTDDPEFVDTSKGPVGRLPALIGHLTRLSSSEEAPSETDRENSALRRFNPQRTVSGLGLTYVIDIGFTSHNPAKSARIINALADAYIDDQLNEISSHATPRASGCRIG